MSKISVIIPAYNASENIRECLDSIINQTYKDLEIIVVDYCTKDDTFKILKDYASRDKRILVVKKMLLI